jgi:anti-anti-sigma factor
MRDSAYPPQCAGQQAIVTLPEHIDVSNAGQVREELLSVINCGAATLIADMTATMSCDHAGAEAVARAYQRAAVAGAELKLVVTDQIVRRVLTICGVDRLVSVYPCLEAAMAARPTAPELALVATISAAGTGGHGPPPRAGQAPMQIRAAGTAGGDGAAFTTAVVWKLVDALQDGVVLAGPDGMIALANARLEEMFGYPHRELLGRPVESLVPAHLQEAHRSHRAAYAQAPRARPMGAGTRLVGLRKDNTTFPAEISLSPVTTAAGQYALTVIRDLTETLRLEQLAGVAGTAIATEQALRSKQLLDTIITSLFGVGLGLQTAMALPPAETMHCIAQALSSLEGTIREIRDTAFASHELVTPAGPSGPTARAEDLPPPLHADLSRPVYAAGSAQR